MDQMNRNNGAHPLHQCRPIPRWKDRHPVSHVGEGIGQSPDSDQSDRIMRGIRLIPITKEKPRHRASRGLIDGSVWADRAGSSMTNPAHSQNGSMMRMIMNVLAPIPCASIATRPKRNPCANPLAKGSVSDKNDSRAQ